MEALTGRRPDVSAMAGFVGQAGWIRKWDGKANAQRDKAVPVIYMHPSACGVGHTVYNLDTCTEQLVYSLSVTTDPTASSLMLAQSAMARPRGAYGTPDEAEYEASLRAMLLPRSYDENTMVQHDPMTGMPAALYRLQPYVDANGELIMYPEGGLPDLGDPSDGIPPPPSAAAALERGPAAPEVRNTPAAGPPVGLPNGAVRWTAGASYRGCTTIRELPHDTRLWYEHGAKKGDTASARRYAKYQASATIAESLVRNPGPKGKKDLANDLQKGLCWLLPPTGVYYADWFSTTNAGRVYAAQHGPIAGIECPEILRTSPRVPRVARPPNLDGPEPWMLRESAMWDEGKADREDAELRRILALDEGPPLVDADTADSVRVEAQHFAEYDHGPVTDGRRYTARYAEGARAAREAVLDDELSRADSAWGDQAVPAFGDGYDIRPSTVMFGASDYAAVPPRSVAAAELRPDYAAPHGWKQAITKEVRRVEGFGAWQLVPMAHYWDELRTHPKRVSIGSWAKGQFA